MGMEPGREILDILSRSPRPLSGEELGSMLQVSSRTVRNRVRVLNRKAELVTASHHGYAISEAGRRALQQQVSTAGHGYDTPQRRLGYLCRVLPQQTGRSDVHELAAHLCVSESTLEGDLARVREVMRQHDIVLRRDHDQVWVEGTERSRRRAVRHVLQHSGHDMSPDWGAIGAEFPAADLTRLRQLVGDTVAASPVEMNEYALGDVVIHLLVTIDRIQSGHEIPAQEMIVNRTDADVDALCQALCDAARDEFGVTLPEAERQSLYAAVAVRTAGRRALNGTDLVPEATLQLVDDCMAWVADHYLLGRPDASTLLKLAVHVENVVARARSGVALSHPLGAAFRNSHPLVHEMALSLAQQLESRLGIEVSPSEVDYLSLHMGMLYMNFLEQRDLPSVTLVAPRYHGLEDTLGERLTEALRGKAVVERTLASPHEAADVSTDLVVACLPVPGSLAPVVMVSPLLSHEDVDRVVSAARQERARIARSRVVTALHTLIDPALFIHRTAPAAKAEVLSEMCGLLEQHGYVEAEFLADVMDRERRSPTSFGGAFAIPHSMRMDARATGVAVMVSDHGIPWGSSSVRVVLLFALSETGRHTFRDGLDEIIRILGEPGAVEALGSATTAHEFLSLLERVAVE